MKRHEELFRFAGYEDVFVEDSHFLYVQQEPWSKPHLLACREYRDVCGELWAGEWAGADVEYLRGLEHAGVMTAARIVKAEARETARYSTGPEEAAAYLEHVFYEIDALQARMTGKGA